MKKESEVKAKLKDARYKYLKHKLKSNLKKCPENCKYNVRHNPTSYEYNSESGALFKPEPSETATVGLCMYGAENPEEWPGIICDDLETARSCNVFEPSRDKEEVKEEFEQELQDDEAVFQNYKDLAALEWVLGEKSYKWDLTPWQSFQYFILYHWLLFLLTLQSRSE